MKTALLIIGDEILAGNTRDLNGHWLSTYLPKLGLSLNQIKIVHDGKEEIQASLDILFKDHDIVFCSGGLGPTKDDITKNVMADYFNKELISDAKSISHIENLYKKIDKEWTTETNDYHFYPQDFELTDNINGLAPGLFYHENEKTILCAPGVPREFSSMVEEVFTPKLISLYGTEVFKPTELFSIRTKGMPEEKIFTTLCPTLWEDLSKMAKVSSLPHLLGVDIVLYMDKSKSEEIKKEVIELINSSPLKEYVWQFGNLELEELVVKLATEKNLTIGFAESCTGGLTSSKITNISGSSRVLLGSIISYANSIKENMLNVSRVTLENHGAVSKECAHEMANGARVAIGCDISISYTGIAGPTGGSEEKPVGTVGIGWSTKETSGSDIFNFRGDRVGLKERFSRMGLFLLLDLIKKY
ncbi:hypothetical protein A9Q84_06370 [Halobacteriovorax marinus]|uniref:CinA-like protein n=1 Tax=Halobacteriovorax marinus TaxID=97084 RepID=A0A1Y5F9E5_9BACT|nr:hypothetical protein A9Q84_06370 [Halobacteriovorax marinus]